MRTDMKYLILTVLLMSACKTGGGIAFPDSGFPADLGADGSMGWVFPNMATVDPCGDPGSTLGESCSGDAACDDRCFCNGVEVCTENVCVAGADACDDGIECTNARCLEEADSCYQHPDHSVCSNGDACDGHELCDITSGCVGVAPLYCNDEISCTFDSCDPAVGCVHTPRDLDEDGFVDCDCTSAVTNCECNDDGRTGALI